MTTARLQAAPLFDKIVFSKVKSALGGRVKLIVTGGAPLARHVEDFLKVTMCCPVVQGYGLTETCAASFIAIPDQAVSETSGHPAHRPGRLSVAVVCPCRCHFTGCVACSIPSEAAGGPGHLKGLRDSQHRRQPQDWSGCALIGRLQCRLVESTLQLRWHH